MPTPEQKIKKELKDYIEKHGGIWFAITGGPYSKPGDPDMIALFGEVGVGIEAKTPTGVQSPIQKSRQAQMERLGCHYILVRSVGELDDELRRRSILKDGE